VGAQPTNRSRPAILCSKDLMMEHSYEMLSILQCHNLHTRRMRPSGGIFGSVWGCKMTFFWC
jgi:hypothetical protein